ncbi:HRDC domain-containing protein [Timonella sp. A28]|uniref:HRDC domain-containing protein n=1 Tax=Timonella sp. A28 TaxID=3442640 RepID=UPI003EBA7BB8
MTSDSAAAPTSTPEDHLIPLDEPAEGTPKVFTTHAELTHTVRLLQAGSGPLAIDAERASGFRYGQRNYLVQVRREGAGTFLIDPVALPDLSEISALGEHDEWVFHAAVQDLPSLHEQNIFPSRIFDTELGSRILGLERVGLGFVVAELLGYRLAKEHSAQDWSTRPLPTEWLKYAALDVELLIPLRHTLAEKLEDAGKLQWALQEFEAVRTKDFSPKYKDPWRRVSGLHMLKNKRELAIARELWVARDRLARHRDVSPSRVLPDRAIIAAAKAKPKTIGELSHLHAFGGPSNRRRAAQWQKAIDNALSLPADELPELRLPKKDAPPAPKVWAERDPQAARRLEKAKLYYEQLSSELSIPIENLLTPDTLRKVCWQPPRIVTASHIGDHLVSLGARPWQVELAATQLARIFNESS